MPAGVFVSIMPELVVVPPGAVSLAGALLDAPLMAGVLVSAEPGADSLAGGLAEPD